MEGEPKTWVRARPKSAYVYGPKSTIRHPDPARWLHPPAIYDPIKFTESAEYFRGNKVKTCKKLLMKYDKQTLAVAYPLPKSGWKNPFSHQNMNKSSETMSI